MKMPGITFNPGQGREKGGTSSFSGVACRDKLYDSATAFGGEHTGVCPTVEHIGVCPTVEHTGVCPILVHIYAYS